MTTDTDSDSGWDWNGNGDTDDSDDDSEADSEDSDMGGSASCGCKGRVKELTVRYNLATANLVEVRRANGGRVCSARKPCSRARNSRSPSSVKKIKFFVNNEKVAMLKTGCKNPIGAGQSIGDGNELVVVSGKSKFRDDRPLCARPRERPAASKTKSRTCTTSSTTVRPSPTSSYLTTSSVLSVRRYRRSVRVRWWTVEATTCIFEDTINIATATGVQGENACASNEATETVDVISCSDGDYRQRQRHRRRRQRRQRRQRTADSGKMDCDRDERRSCYGGRKHHSDSDSHIDWNHNGDSDDSDSRLRRGGLRRGRRFGLEAAATGEIAGRNGNSLT